MSDLEVFRRAERLEWHAHTVFDGDKPGGDGNIDGELRAIGGTRVVADLPLDIYTPGAWEGLGGSASLWTASGCAAIIADPRTSDAVREEIRGWCRRALDRDDVNVTL